jgi:hypothetical protein
MHGLKGGRWRSGSHGEPDDAHPPGNQAGLSPTTYRVPTNQRPTSLLTGRPVAKLAEQGRDRTRAFWTGGRRDGCGHR